MLCLENVFKVFITKEISFFFFANNILLGLKFCNLNYASFAKSFERKSFAVAFVTKLFTINVKLKGLCDHFSHWIYNIKPENINFQCFKDTIMKTLETSSDTKHWMHSWYLIVCAKKRITIYSSLLCAFFKLAFWLYQKN